MLDKNIEPPNSLRNADFEDDDDQSLPTIEDYWWTEDVGNSNEVLDHATLPEFVIEERHDHSLPVECLDALAEGAGLTDPSLTEDPLTLIDKEVRKGRQLTPEQVMTLVQTIRDNASVSNRAIQILGRSLSPQGSPEEQVTKAIERLGELAKQNGPDAKIATLALFRILCRNAYPQHNDFARDIWTQVSALSEEELGPRARQVLTLELSTMYDLSTVTGIKKLAEFANTTLAGADTFRTPAITLLRETLLANAGQSGGDQIRQAQLRQAALHGLLLTGFSSTRGISELADMLGQNPSELIQHLATPEANLPITIREHLIDVWIDELSSPRYTQPRQEQDTRRAQALEHLSKFIQHLPIESRTTLVHNLVEVARANTITSWSDVFHTTSEAPRIRAAIVSIGTHLLLTSDQQQQTQDLLRMLDPRLAPGFLLNNEIRERAMVLVNGENSTTARAAARFLLSVAQTQPEHAPAISQALSQPAKKHESVREQLASAAATGAEGESALARQILNAVGRSPELARSVTECLILEVTSRYRPCSPERRSELCTDIQALAQLHPQIVAAELRRRNVADVGDILAKMAASDNPLVRDHARQTLLGMATNREQRETIVRALGESYRTTGSEQLIPLMAAICQPVRMNNIPEAFDRQAALAALRQRAEQLNDTAINALSHIAQRNGESGIQAALILQHMATAEGHQDWRSPASQRRSAVLSCISACLENTPGNINSPLLNAWVNIVLRERSAPVTNDPQMQQRLVAAIRELPLWDSHYPYERRSNTRFFGLLGRLVAGDAGSMAASAAAGIIPSCGSRHFPSMLTERLYQIYQQHGDHHSLLFTLGRMVTGEGWRSTFQGELERQLQAVPGETAQQQIQRLERSARALSALMRSPTLSRPEILQQLLATPQTRDAFQAAALSLVRSPQTSTTADVQALTDLSRSLRADLREGDGRTAILNIVLDSLRNIASSPAEATRHAARVASYLEELHNAPDAVAYTSSIISRLPNELRISADGGRIQISTDGFGRLLEAIPGMTVRESTSGRVRSSLIIDGNQMRFEGTSTLAFPTPQGECSLSLHNTSAQLSVHGDPGDGAVIRLSNISGLSVRTAGGLPAANVTALDVQLIDDGKGNLSIQLTPTVEVLGNSVVLRDIPPIPIGHREDTPLPGLLRDLRHWISNKQERNAGQLAESIARMFIDPTLAGLLSGLRSIERNGDKITINSTSGDHSLGGIPVAWDTKMTARMVNTGGRLALTKIEGAYLSMPLPGDLATALGMSDSRIPVLEVSLSPPDSDGNRIATIKTPEASVSLKVGQDMIPVAVDDAGNIAFNIVMNRDPRVVLRVVFDPEQAVTNPRNMDFRLTVSNQNFPRAVEAFFGDKILQILDKENPILRDALTGVESIEKRGDTVTIRRSAASSHELRGMKIELGKDVSFRITPGNNNITLSNVDGVTITSLPEEANLFYRSRLPVRLHSISLSSADQNGERTMSILSSGAIRSATIRLNAKMKPQDIWLTVENPISAFRHSYNGRPMGSDLHKIRIGADEKLDRDTLNLVGMLSNAGDLRSNEGAAITAIAYLLNNPGSPQANRGLLDALSR